MNKLPKSFNLCLVIFVLSVVGSCLLYAKPASALWDNQVPKYYKVFVKTGTNTVIANKSTTPSSPSWVLDSFLPQITTDGRACDSGNNVVRHDFNSKLVFWNCEALTIQEATTPAGNDDWFQQANISYVIGDFDSAETIEIGRGYIVGHGKSTIGNPNGTQNARAYKSTAPKYGDCDNPNPNYSNDCSLLIYFTSGDPGDFHISIDNVYNNGSPSSGHEYWYNGPITNQYRTLTFNPNGGSVADNKVQDDGTIGDETTLVSHTSGFNVLREYAIGSTANEFPTPTWSGHTFQGWYTAVSGGTLVSSRLMASDQTLYAHWEQDIIVDDNFTLNPYVTATPRVIEQGSSVTVVSVVTNTPGTSASPAGQWKLVKEVNSISTEIVSPTMLPAINSGSNWSTSYLDNTTDYPAGTHIYYILSVKPSSNTNGDWVSSARAEVVVGSKPKVQVWGGDLFVGGYTDTSTSTKSGKTFGSWVEYAIFAVGNIKYTASGAAFAQQGLATVNSSTFPCRYSTLSFANVPVSGTCTGADGTIGHYSNVLSAPDVGARFPTSSSTPSVLASSDLSGLSGLFKANNNITITGGNIAKGKWVVINAPTRNVSINGDINYTNETLHSVGDIPQVVIIANNITINSSVKHLDAWLIAKNGNIYTCETDPKTINDCKDQLVVNGPVIANKLYLRRTFGSGSGGASGDPAEIFNLRADAYLWGYGLSSGEGKIQTVYTTELPPRL